MKSKNRLSKAIAFLVLLAVIAMILVADTYSKYTTTASGTDSVLVANWSFDVNGQDITILGTDEEFEFNLFDTATIKDSDGNVEEDVEEGLIAPGTSGAFEFELFNTSDVTTQYKLELSVDNTDIPIEFSYDGDTWTKDLTELVAEDKMAIGDVKYITVMWRWPFGENIVTASELGGQSITVTASISAMQVDSSDLEVANNWENKTAVFVGDSITYGAHSTTTYWKILDEELNLSTVTGMGVNSSCISTKSDYGTSNQPLINRYTTIPDADLISIFMGTNDYGHETPLGTINDTTDVSFYGALNIIVPQLKNAHPNSRIVFLTPIHRYGAGTSGILGTKFTYDNIDNGAGANLEDYVNAIKAVCAKYSIPVIDLYTLYDLDVTNADVRTQYMPDGLHPNAEGHQILADIIAGELRKITPINKTNNNNTTVDINTVTLQIGNDYGSANLDSLNRLSVTKNVYLEAGTIISLKNPDIIKYSLYSQSSENLVFSTNITGGYITTDYTITTSGWYGFAFAKNDNTDFDLGGNDSNLLIDYIKFLEETETDTNVTLQIGNDYGSTTSENTNRASLTKNIYLKSGTIISVKDTSKHKYSLYNQNSANLEYSTNITGGWTNEQYKITQNGWYGISLATVDDSDFDLGGTDSNVITGYINFVQPNEMSTDLNVAMQLGNKFDANYESATNRATVINNIYLRAGTVISLKDSSTYNYGLMAQTDEIVKTYSSNVTYLTGGWTADTYTITVDGYYGIAVKRVDNAVLDLGGTDSNVITGYLNFNK